MKKSNLFAILSSLNKKEVRELRKWLQSPAHNQRPDVISLFEFFIENLTPSRQENLTKEKAFELVFPEEKAFNDAKMRQSMHFLFKSLEEFLVFNELQADEVKAKTVFAKVLRKKRLGKVFQKAIFAAHEKQDKGELRNTIYHQNDYEIRQEEIRFAASHGRGKGFDFQSLSDSLDTMYLSAKLREACTMISYQTVTKTELNTGLLDNILEYLESNPQLILTPAIGVYYFGLKCTMDNQDDKSFQSLKNLIFTAGDLFPHFEFRDIYLIAINFCIRRMNTGDEIYVRESFELYQNGVKTKVLLENGILSRFAFQNMVSIACRLKEFAWTEDFLDNQEALLEKKIRENIIHYCRSKLAYERGDYDHAMILLSQIEYNDILMNLSGKTMLLKMFYEEGNFDSLDSLISSTNTYIQRKKVIGYHKSNYKNIFRMTKKLVKVNPYDRVAVNKLKEQIEVTNPLTEKDWLLGRVENL
ncbi:MAG: hypothetical protein HKN16_10770 [Saprospiraceae bacterium]|nr:hypothetical protein [Saprospiraceae bacterium]